MCHNIKKLDETKKYHKTLNRTSVDTGLVWIMSLGPLFWTVSQVEPTNFKRYVSNYLDLKHCQ